MKLSIVFLTLFMSLDVFAISVGDTATYQKNVSFSADSSVEFETTMAIVSEYQNKFEVHNSCTNMDNIIVKMVCAPDKEWRLKEDFCDFGNMTQSGLKDWCDKKGGFMGKAEVAQVEIPVCQYTEEKSDETATYTVGLVPFCLVKKDLVSYNPNRPVKDEVLMHVITELVGHSK